MLVLRTIETAELPAPGDALPDCLAGRAPEGPDCCAFHRVDWARAVRFATWAWYCRDDGESPQERMARVVGVPPWLVQAAACLITDPIQLHMDGARATGYDSGHVRAAALRAQRCRFALVAQDCPDGHAVGELLDPALLTHR